MALLASAFVALGAAGFVGAQTTQGSLNLVVGSDPSIRDANGGVKFDCNSLYSGNTAAPNSGGTNTAIYRVNLDQMVGTNVTVTPMINLQTGGASWPTRAMATTALGKVNGELQMWGWNYDASPPQLSYIKNGATNGELYGRIIPSGNTGGSNTWAGGEFNQLTGEIYMSSTEGNTLNSGAFAIFNPLTGEFKYSRSLQPAPGTAAVSGGLSSDMAVDALGNLYNLVGGANNKTLVRIIPGESNTTWYYNKVRNISDSTLPSSNYGMAFLNGKLYVTGPATQYLYEINTLSGAVTRLTFPSGSVPNPYDLAACQVAPVIQGYIYNDTVGDGSVTPGTSAGVAGVVVDIYKHAMVGGVPTSVYMGSSDPTDASGYYSFIVDSTNATYFLRVRQPQINGINAAQTWASVGGAQNKTTAVCLDENDPTAPAPEKFAAGPALEGVSCSGTKLFGADPAGPSAFGTSWDITQAQIYSKVVMTTDEEVANADFGISTAASYGDAATGSNFNVLYASGGPFHVIANKRLWLGDTVDPYTDGIADTNTNAHASDDGVTIKLGGVYMPLQNVVLAKNRSNYELRVKLNGDFSSKGYLNVSDNANAANAVATKFTDLQSSTGEINITNYATRNTGNTLDPIVTRFRFSSTQGLPPQSTAAAPGAGQQAIGSTSTTVPWVIDGEVEDYRTWQASALIRVQLIGSGNFASPAAFNYAFTSEISNTSPSSNSSTLTATTAGATVVEASGVVHAITNASPQDVTITQTPPAPGDKWKMTVSCFDSVTLTPISTTSTDTAVTVKGSDLVMGSDVTCLFTNAFASATPENSTLVVTPAGPIHTNTDSYTVTVTANDASNVPQSNIPIVLTVSGGTLAQGSTGTFAAGTCTTDASGTCTVTWTSANSGTFTINAKLDGTDVGKCAVDPNTCSSQSRQFVNAYVAGQSELTASPTSVTANGTDFSVLTVTLKDANGAVTTSIGPTTVSFSKGASDKGTFSANSCTVLDNTSSCTVHITSTETGTATVTANIGGMPVSPAAGVLITFTNSPISTTNSTLVADPTSVPANGTSQSQVTITLKDGSNNIYTTPTLVTFSVPASTDGTISPLTCTTDAVTGACSVTYTSPPVINGAAKATVTAAIDGAGNKTVDISLTTDRDIVITKTVVDNVGGYVSGGKFDIAVKCNGILLDTLHLANGDSDKVTAKVGDTCTIEETVPSGTLRVGATNKATYPSTIVVLGAESQRDISIVNTITSDPNPPYTLSVHKTVIDTFGADDPNAVFPITVTCTAGDADNKTVNVRKNEIGHVDVSAGATDCTIDEPLATRPNPTNPAYTYVPDISPSTIDNVSANNDVYVTNRVTDQLLWKVYVKNTVSGLIAPSGYVSPGNFDVTLDCGVDFKSTNTMTEGNTSLYNVPMNAVCALSTDTSPSKLPTLNSGYVWYAHTSTPSSPFTATNGMTATENHDIQQSGTVNLKVTKTVTASDKANGYVAGGLFDITVTCNGVATTLHLADGDSDTTILAHPGDICTIAEAAPPATVVKAGYTNEATYPSKIVVSQENFREFIVSNAITAGTTATQVLTVSKIVTGTTADHDPNAKFAITVTCDPDPNSVKTVSLMRDEDAHVEVAKGATCTITEAAATALNGYHYAPAFLPGTIGPMDADDGATVNNIVTNQTMVNVSVKNTVSEAASGDITGSGYVAGSLFNITLNCGATTYTQDMAEGPGYIYTYPVPTGSNCTVVTNTKPTLPNNANYEWSSDTVSGLTNPVTSAQTAVVDHQIKKSIGDVDCTNSSVIADPSSLDANGTSTSTVTVTLKDDRGTLVPSITVNLSVDYGTLSAQSCTTNASGVCTVTYTSPSTIPAGGIATVTATSSPAFACGSLSATIGLGGQKITVHKTVTGTGYVAGATFAVNVSCTGGYNKPMNLVNGGEDSIVVPVGSVCTVTEAEPDATVIGSGNTNLATIAPTNFTVVAGVDETVQITNKIVSGSVPKGVMTIHKSVVGDAGNIAAGHDPLKEFEISVVCTTVTPASPFQLRQNQTATVEGPVGESCTIAESLPMMGLAGYQYVPYISPSTTKLRATGVSVEVENAVMPYPGTYYPVSLRNAVTGDQTPSLYDNNGSFILDLTCGAFRRTSQMLVGDISSYYVLSGSICTVVKLEPRPLINDPLTWNWDTPTYDPDSQFVVNAAVNEVVTHPLTRTPFKWVKVTKTVTGLAALDKFTVILNCGAAYTKTMQLGSGEFDQLLVPIGNSCTVTENEPGASVIGSGNSNTATISPSEFTVPSDEDVNVGVTNHITAGSLDKATLRVVKMVTGSNKANDLLATTNDFGIRVECPGQDAADLTLRDGWVGTVQGTLGQRCVVTEPTIPAATSPYHYVANNTGTVTLQADNGATPGVTLTIENMVVTGTLYPVTVSNAVIAVPSSAAALASYNATQPFVLSMTCGTNPDYDYTISQSVGDTRDVNVPAGTICAIVTTTRPLPMLDSNYKWDNSGVAGTLYNPESEFTVNAAMNETATHAIIPAPMKLITVKKSVTGGSTTSTFSVQVDCYSDDTKATKVVSKTMTLANGGSDSVQTLSNSVCTVTENHITLAEPANGYTAMILPSEFTVDDDQDVLVENRIEPNKPNIVKAWVTVTKEVAGALSQDVPTNTFGIDVACNGTTLASFTGANALKAGWSASVEGEVGQNCTITEPTLPSPKAGYKYAPSISPSTSRLPAAGLDVIVTNTIIPTSTVTHTVTLRNAVSNDPTPTAFDNDGMFMVALNCGTGTVYDFDPVPMVLGAISSYTVAEGQSCNVSIGSKPAINTGYKWAGESFNPDVPFIVDGDKNEVVTHDIQPINWFKVIVHKTVNDTVGSAYQGGKFDITVTCGAATPVVLQLASGEDNSADPIWAPENATCTVEEAEPAAAIIGGSGNNNTYVIAPSGFTMGTNQVDVYITNRIAAGPITKGKLTVAKTVLDNYGAHSADNVFGILVDCAGTTPATFNLLAGQKGTVQGTLGAQCTVSEPTIPALSGIYRYVANISPTTTTLRSDQLATIQNMVVTGIFNEVRLTNLVDGDLSKYDNNVAFGMKLDCGVAPYIWTPDMFVGDKSTFNVPAGSSCTASTTSWPTPASGYEWKPETYSQTNPFIVSSVANTPTDDTATHYIDTIINPPDCTTSSIVTSSSSLRANGSTSTITVTLKDANGNVPTSTVVTFTLPTGGYGTLSATSCTTSATTGSCSVTYTSPNVIPLAGMAVVTADVAGLTCTNLTTNINLSADNAPVIVTKTLMDPNGLYVSGNFDVTLTCGAESEVLHFAPTGSDTVWMPTNVQCTVSENTSGANISGGTSRKTIFPTQFVMSDADIANGVSVSVENELLPGSVPLAPLTVSKTVIDTYGSAMSGHDPMTLFDIVATSSLSPKTLQLRGGWVGTTDMLVSDTVIISETPPGTLTWPYAYSPTINPSKIASMQSTGRTVGVTNEVTTFPSPVVTFVQGVVTDMAGSGYTIGSILTTNVTCGTQTYSLPLAEGDESQASIASGTTCGSAVAGTLPALNSSFYFVGPTTNPSLPYTVNAAGTIIINYAIAKRNANEPIPTLDPKALLMLIGLLTGLAFWQRKRWWN
ncbi:MAG: DUF5979 domain-containing protein [Burkholderiales bacterium]|nr:DUF5979 domain-containing protein [Burkholderiales bacterium]